MATTQTETITQSLIPIAMSDGLSQPQGKIDLNVVFGAMALGGEGPGAEGAHIHTGEDVASVIDVFQQHGHNEIHAARVYGKSEALLGQLKWQERGLVMDTKLNPGSMGPYHRYDPVRFQSKSFRGRYWTDAYFSALDVLRKATDAHGMSLGEAALRCSSYHSAMKRECGDGVVFGASNAAQLEKNLRCLEGGHLLGNVVGAIQKA